MRGRSSTRGARAAAALVVTALMAYATGARADKAPPPPPETSPAATAPATGSGAPRRGDVVVPAGDLTVALYTVGRGPELFERYGHSLLCVRAAAAKADDLGGTCIDYGVAEAKGALAVGWATLRGEPTFVPVAVDEKLAVAFFGGHGRSLERQTLPLTPAQARRLADRLADDVRARRGYAYHPATSNCATHLRDRLDEATDGALRAGFTGLGSTTRRHHLEEGLSGRVLPLVATALVCDATCESTLAPWDAMFLPFSLRDGVAERLGAAPERVAEPLNYELPTSSGVGRLALVAFAVALLALARRAEGPRGTLARAVVGGTLGGLALVLEAVAAISAFPEPRHTWALLALWPTDLALPWLRGRTLARYATVRAGVAVALALAEVLGVTRQSTLPIALLVLLPMLGLRGAARRARAASGPPVDEGAPLVGRDPRPVPKSPGPAGGLPAFTVPAAIIRGGRASDWA